MSRVATALVVALVLLVAVGCSGSRDRAYDGGCGRGHSTVSAVRASDGAVRWRRSLPHPREDRPEVAGGRVLLRGCGVTVLDTADGRVRLRSSKETDVVGLSGRYLVTSRDGAVTAEPLTGRGGFGASSQPPYEQVAVAGDLLLATSGGTVSGWRTNGAPGDGWRAELPTAARASVATAGDLLVLRADDGSVYGVAVTDGAVRWRAVPAGQDLGYGVPLAVTPEALVVPVGAPPSWEVAALDAHTGGELWRAAVDTSVPVTGRWAAADGVVVVPHADGAAALDLRTGRRLWRSDLDPADAVGVGTTLVLAEPQAVVGVDARSGRELWRTATRHRPLLAADERAGAVVVLDSPPVPRGYDDCC